MDYTAQWCVCYIEYIACWCLLVAMLIIDVDIATMAGLTIAERGWDRESDRER